MIITIKHTVADGVLCEGKQKQKHDLYIISQTEMMSTKAWLFFCFSFNQNSMSARIFNTKYKKIAYGSICVSVCLPSVCLSYACLYVLSVYMRICCQTLLDGYSINLACKFVYPPLGPTPSWASPTVFGTAYNFLTSRGQVCKFFPPL